MPVIAPNQGFTITSQHATSMYSLRLPYYVLAALFAVLACLYSLWSIRFMRVLMRWYFWLTFGSVFLVTAGYLVFFVAGISADSASAPRRRHLPQPECSRIA
jgi:prepilin signal peptidase PulO-like enzyme (type II secretory pathway)